MIFTHSDEVLVPIGTQTITPGCMVQHTEVEYMGTVISVIDHKVTVLWPDNVSFDVIAETVRTVVKRSCRQLLRDFRTGRITKSIDANDIKSRCHAAMELLVYKGRINKFVVHVPEFDDIARTVTLSVRYMERAAVGFKVLTVVVTL